MVHRTQRQHQSAAVHQQTQSTQAAAAGTTTATRKSVGVMGSRRIFAPTFKLKVLDSYRNDIDCRGNQRATARKYGIHRRQIQKWLQCEETLRNNCGDTSNSNSNNNNTTAVVATATVISSTGVSKPDGTVTEATGPAVTPAAPALNLSLARLHGDELATQQGPPPLLPHPPHGGAPSSPQYVAQCATTPAMPVRYPEYTINQEQRHLRRETDDRVQESVHDYRDTEQQQSRYYITNTDGNHREIESSSYDGRGEIKVYQNLTSYHRVLQRTEHRYVEAEMNHQHHQHHHRSPSHNRSQQSHGDVDSPVDGKPSYGLLLAPSMIKTERASPDSAATPGPCESTFSPCAPRGPLSPVSRSPTSNSSSSSASYAYIDSPRAPASPCLHVHIHAHASPLSDSEKPIRDSTKSHIGEKGPEDTAEEIGGAIVKEELMIEEEQEASEDGREAAVSYVDYQRPPPVGSRPVSPMPEREGYSLPSSPRRPASSGRSSSSYSDSEMDPLDCSSGSQNSSNDLVRRRSFSLRFKLDVLDAFHRDVSVAGNQRATARKFGINRRQVQKWLGQEDDLRGEITVRGNSRQRLGPVQDVASGESPVDLRTSTYASGLSQDRIAVEYETSPPPPPLLYCCDLGSSSSQHLPYYQRSVLADPASEGEQTASCTFSCCLESNHAAASVTSYYQEVSLRGSCYSDPAIGRYCYSPIEYPTEIRCVSEFAEEAATTSSRKRHHCDQPCCYEEPQSPKKIYLELEEPARTGSACQESPARETPPQQAPLQQAPPREAPPQETPLCLVKPKRSPVSSPSRTEPVTSTVPTPPMTSTVPTPPMTSTTVPTPPATSSVSTLPVTINLLPTLPVTSAIAAQPVTNTIPTQAVTNAGPTPPAAAAPPPAAAGPTTQDAILFKPYLDNPVSKPPKEPTVQRDLSPVSNQNVNNNNNNNNNNNCQSICNFNEARGHDYALEFSLRLPISWRAHPSSYTEFPQVRSAFVRYPSSPHYT